MKIVFNQDMSSPSCARVTLSRVSIGSVELCLCGSIHLTIGPLTLRLERDSLAELAVLVGDAADELRRAIPPLHARGREALS
jgi:hypothetical protein